MTDTRENPTTDPTDGDPNLEAQLRKAEPPRCETETELAEYIRGLVELNHSYGSCVYAMSLAAQASFNYMARKLGVTGFPASCADMTFLSKTRGLEGPFMILKAENMLYPQYDLHNQLSEAMKDWGPWAGDEARKALAHNSHNASNDVTAHWERLASENPPTTETK